MTTENATDAPKSKTRRLWWRILLLAALAPAELALTTGMFAEGDELVHCGTEFEEHYPGRAVYYPGAHLPVFPELKRYLVPQVRALCPET